MSMTTWPWRARRHGREAGAPAGVPIPSAVRILSPVPILWAALILGVALAGALPATAAVRINEIMADPATDWNGDGTADYKTDEWIEIVNLGPDPVDLAGY